MVMMMAPGSWEDQRRIVDQDGTFQVGELGPGFQSEGHDQG